MIDEYLKIRAVPVFENVLTPVLKKHTNILNSDSEYIDIRVYKNKYVLDHFEINMEELNVFSFNKDKIYNIVKQEKRDNSKIVCELKNLYDSNQVTKIIDELMNMSNIEYISHEKYEDYDFDECLHISTDKLLKKYFNQVEIIYILISFLYPEYMYIYYDIYKEL